MQRCCLELELSNLVLSLPHFNRLNQLRLVVRASREKKMSLRLSVYIVIIALVSSREICKDRNI